MRHYRLIIVLLIITSCKSASVTTTKEAYEEDISVHRPSIEISEELKDIPDVDEDNTLTYKSPVSTINEEIDSINSMIIRENSDKNYHDGYSIQIYRGNSREEAETARAKARVIFPDMKPDLSYYQPTYRVKMGSFFDRLEATRAFKEVKNEFPRALLLPEELPLPDEDDDR